MVRPTRAEDAVALRDLRLEALRDHPEAFSADYAEAFDLGIDAWEARAARGAGNDREIIYVADANGALVGMTGVYREATVKLRHVGNLWGVYVRPGWRGQGVADALLAACIAWAREHGLRSVKLGVATANTAAVRCYARCGFSVYGVEPEYIFHDNVYHDELLMTRRL